MVGTVFLLGTGTAPLAFLNSLLGVNLPKGKEGISLKGLGVGGHLSNRSNAGLSYVNGWNGLSTGNWNYAA